MTTTQQVQDAPVTELVAASIKKGMTGVKSADLWQPQVSQLKIIDNFNARIKDAGYYAHIRTLADSMKANGFYKHRPLEVFVAEENGEVVIYVTDGHCRYEAVLLANSELSESEQITHVYAVTSEKGTSMEDLTVGLIQSNNGRDLSQYEKGVVIKRLSQHFKMSTGEIARRCSVSTTYVDRMLVLMGSPSRVREMVRDGNVAADVAIDAIKEHGSNVVAVLEGKLAELVASYRAKYPEAAAASDAAAAAAGTEVNAEGEAAPASTAVAPVVKITKKHMKPQASVQQKLIVKAAPQMFSTMNKLKAHPIFDQLPLELREEVAALLAGLEAPTEPVIDDKQVALEFADAQTAGAEKTETALAA